MFLSTLVVAVTLASPGFVLHEWGTFTSVAGEDGLPIEWKPLLGPSDLPSFVYSLGNPGTRIGFVGKGDMRGNVRMETPVIYFYAQHEMDVSLKVGFTGGTITEWYPWVKSFEGNSIDWGTFKLMPGATPDLPREAAPSHYYPARNVDAVPVRVCSSQGSEKAQFERFLFYRGVGTFALPLSAKLQNNDVTLSGVKGDALVFERRGAQVGVTRVAMNGAPVTTKRPVLNAKAEDAHALVLELLISSGLYEKEAKAMLETWRDTWFEDGLRVMYLVPRATTDALLPLEVKPAPSQSVRVLVGRFELLTKERVESVRTQLSALKDVTKLGRFGEPLLVRARQGASAADQKRIDQLLSTLSAPVVGGVAVQ